MRRVYGSFRHLLRRLTPGPGEQQWLRLVLLVRRLQRGQLAFAERLDEIRTLSGVVGAFRSDFGALHEQLGAARVSAAELERGLAEGLGKLSALPDPHVERAALDQRLGAFDASLARLERLAGQAPAEAPIVGELKGLLAHLGELAARFESVSEAERATGGQDELARLYERIQDLAEGMATSRQGGEAQPEPDPFETLERFGEQIAQLSEAVEALAPNENASSQDEALARLERLAERLNPRTRRGAAPSAAGAPEELQPLLERFESVAQRLEQAQGALPELPPDTMLGDAGSARELEELHVQLLGEQEARRQVEEQLATLRDRLRASELARVELETRHTTEMADMADHVGRQLQRVEDDLKKKKRGLSELTQQNIQLQNRLGQLQLELEARTTAEPPPALPRGPRANVRPAPPAGEPAGERDEDESERS